MFDDADNEAPAPQKLRGVRLVDVQPGRLKHPETGPQVAIVTLRSKLGVEQPLAFGLEDVKRLAIALMAVWGHHENATPEDLIESYLVLNTLGAAFEAMPDAPQATQEPQATPKAVEAQRTPLSVQMGFSDASLKPVTVQVLGGYRLNWRRMILLVSCDDLGVLTLAELGPNNTITFTSPMSEASAETFIADPKIRLGDVSWPKLTVKELRAVVTEKVYTYASYQRLPRPGNKRGRPAGSRPATGRKKP